MLVGEYRFEVVRFLHLLLSFQFSSRPSALESQFMSFLAIHKSVTPYNYFRISISLPVELEMKLRNFRKPQPCKKPFFSLFPSSSRFRYPHSGNKPCASFTSDTSASQSQYACIMYLLRNSASLCVLTYTLFPRLVFVITLTAAFRMSSVISLLYLFGNFLHFSIEKIASSSAVSRNCVGDRLLCSVGTDIVLPFHLPHLGGRFFDC